MLRASAIGARSAVIAGLLCCACTGPHSPVSGPTVQQVAQEQPRVLWVAAHPDDEALGGGAVASLCVGAQSPCHFLVFNRGRGGECLMDGGCWPDLGTLRHRELRRAARLYRATLEHYDFFNASLPMSSFPSRQELEQIWMREGDPAGLVARAVRRFRPDVVLTLDPYQGFTGHPEHQAAARFALEGIRRAADTDYHSDYVVGEAPHKVRYLYHVLNKYWFMRLSGASNDPKPYNETIDATGSCGADRHGRTRSCMEVIVANSRVHESQYGDMRSIRSASRFWGTTYLRRIDPFGAEADELVGELVPQPTAKEPQ